MRSLPLFQTRFPEVPVIAKKDLKTSVVRKPFGRSAEWLDIKLITK